MCAVETHHREEGQMSHRRASDLPFEDDSTPEGKQSQEQKVSQSRDDGLMQSGKRECEVQIWSSSMRISDHLEPIYEVRVDGGEEESESAVSWLLD